MATVLAVYNSDGCVGRCDAKCHGAVHAVCDCICGGINHGATPQQVRENTERLAREWVERAGGTEFEIFGGERVPAGQDKLPW